METGKGVKDLMVNHRFYFETSDENRVFEVEELNEDIIVYSSISDEFYIKVDSTLKVTIINYEDGVKTFLHAKGK